MQEGLDWLWSFRIVALKYAFSLEPKQDSGFNAN